MGDSPDALLGYAQSILNPPRRFISDLPGVEGLQRDPRATEKLLTGPPDDTPQFLRFANDFTGMDEPIRWTVEQASESSGAPGFAREFAKRYPGIPTAQQQPFSTLHDKSVRYYAAARQLLEDAGRDITKLPESPLLRSVPDNDWPLMVQIVQNVASEQRARGRDQNEPLFEKSVTQLFRGAYDTIQSIGRMSDQALSEFGPTAAVQTGAARSERDTLRQAELARAIYLGRPAGSDDPSILRRGVAGAAYSAPFMVSTALASLAGGPLAGLAATAAQMIPQEVSSLQDEGYGKLEALIGGSISGIIQSLVEQGIGGIGLPNARALFGGLGKEVTKESGNYVASVGKTLLHDFFHENLENVLQDATQVVTRSVLSNYVDKNIPFDAREAVTRSLESIPDNAVALGLMMLPHGVKNLAQAYSLERASRYPRIDQLEAPPATAVRDDASSAFETTAPEAQQQPIPATTPERSPVRNFGEQPATMPERYWTKKALMEQGGAEQFAAVDPEFANHIADTFDAGKAPSRATIDLITPGERWSKSERMQFAERVTKSLSPAETAPSVGPVAAQPEGTANGQERQRQGQGSEALLTEGRPAAAMDQNTPVAAPVVNSEDSFSIHPSNGPAAVSIPQDAIRVADHIRQAEPSAFIKNVPIKKGQNAQKIERARLAVENDLNDLKKNLAILAQGGSLGALGANTGDVLKSLTRLAISSSKLGILKFSDFMARLGTMFGHERARDHIQPIAIEAWREARKSDSRLDEPTDQSEMLNRMQNEAFAATPRPDLAVPVDSDPGQKTLATADIIREQEGVRQRTDAEIFRDAEALLNEPGGRKRVIDRLMSEDQLSGPETRAAQAILDKQSRDAFASRDKQQMMEAVNLALAYRESGSRQSEAFRARQVRARAVSEARANAIAERGPGAEPTEREITSAHSRQIVQDAVFSGMDEAERADTAKLAAEIEKLTNALNKIGIDLAAILNDKNVSQADAARAVKQIGILRSSVPDMLYEFWISSILSGPHTDIANIGGNAAMAAYHFFGRRLVESAIGSITGKGGARLSDYKSITKRIVPSFAQAARNFLLTYRFETSQFERDIKGPSGIPKVEVGPKIPGPFGRGVRAIGTTKLAAEDDFFKTAVANLEVQAQAERIARERKLKGDEFDQFVVSQVADTSSDSWRAAVDIATELTFTKRTRVGGAITNLRNAIPGARYLIPFVNVSLNILSTGIRISPGGASYDFYRAVKTGDYSKIPSRIAEQLLGFGVAALIIGTNNPDNPWLTGTQDAGPYPRQSLYIPGSGWWYYGRIEPFATALGLIADFSSSLHRKSFIEALGNPPVSLLHQVTSKTFLSGVSDIIELIDQAKSRSGERTETQVGKFVLDFSSKFVVSWIPNLYRQIAGEFRNEQPERSMWGGNGWEYANRELYRLAQKSELFLVPDTPRYDVWGRSIPQSQYPRSLLPLRILSVMDVGVQPPFQGDVARLIWNNHTLDPNKQFNPVAPDKYFQRQDGPPVYLTDDQYGRMAQAAGSAARIAVDRIGVNQNDPHQADIDFMKSARSHAENIVRDKMKPEVLYGDAAATLDPNAIATDIVREVLAGSVRKMGQMPEVAKIGQDKRTVADANKRLADEQIQEAKWLSERGLTPRTIAEAFIRDASLSGRMPSTHTLGYAIARIKQLTPQTANDKVSAPATDRQR